MSDTFSLRLKNNLDGMKLCLSFVERLRFVN